MSGRECYFCGATKDLTRTKFMNNTSKEITTHICIECRDFAESMGSN